MSDPFPDLPDPVPERSRHRTWLLAAIIFLIVAAVFVVGFATIVPMPVRLFIATCDLLAAAALGMVLRQNPRGE